MADLRLCSVQDCGKPFNAKGFCQKHYIRFLKYGDPLFTKTSPGGYVQKYFEEVVCQYEGDDCLIWPYSRSGSSKGYASFWHNGKTSLVCRVVCEKANGAPPKNNHAAHTCGNGHLGCVTKRHLSWKTVKENSEDKIAHGTRRAGQENGNSKLTESDVLAILTASGVSHSQLARQYGVSQPLISKIRRREMWKHL
ncbi:hypothetical protein G9X67_34550 [Rhizobium sp. WYCCWR 11152]|uniref:hypothetical protein n=1 Tax=Rhizobium sp. WYCCWR 11152 TaxID=2692316 RepID=UPI0014912D88|nr:hypothetical protein [Rhizobium sp. WYCCWR 11152]NNU70378.1 hypothetical protein [Rhizobium sp. WYCCWR 11152]